MDRGRESEKAREGEERPALWWVRIFENRRRYQTSFRRPPAVNTTSTYVLGTCTCTIRSMSRTRARYVIYRLTSTISFRPLSLQTQSLLVSLRFPLSAQELTAREHALALLTVEDWPELDQIKALHKALKKADEDWVAAFRENLGMDGIGKVSPLQPPPPPPRPPPSCLHATRSRSVRR